jgi:hypothetical protein
LTVAESQPSSGRYQQIVQIAEFADNELGLDLWLIAERLMLYRLTRAGDQKRYELASLVHAIRDIMSFSRGEEAIPSKIALLDASGSDGFRGRADAKLAQVFSIVVDAAEQMNSEELYMLIALLRRLEGPKAEELDTEPLDRAEEILSRSSTEDSPWSPLNE